MKALRTTAELADLALFVFGIRNFLGTFDRFESPGLRNKPCALATLDLSEPPKGQIFLGLSDMAALSELQCSGGAKEDGQ
jgi:hypothetical protein